ncbi:hypothetical protein F5141DRAFT_1062850 [Pisolithus sp. B1]|nr:hypothetical protein F5141DRAFT_1062850 [Pisolithus sp. B1]
MQILDLQANIQFCSGFLNRVKVLALVELDVKCNTTDGADDAYQFMTSMFMIGVSMNVPLDPYNVLTTIYHKSKLWVCLCSTKSLDIILSKDVHSKIMEEAWLYLFEHLNMVSSLNLGNYPVPCILKNLYCNARGALEAKKQGKKNAPIDCYVALREMDTYHVVWEHITSWLEGNVTDAQMEDDNESVRDSDDAED